MRPIPVRPIPEWSRGWKAGPIAETRRVYAKDLAGLARCDAPARQTPKVYLDTARTLAARIWEQNRASLR